MDAFDNFSERIIVTRNQSNHPLFVPITICAATLRADKFSVIGLASEALDIRKLTSEAIDIAIAARQNNLNYFSPSVVQLEKYRTMSKRINGYCGSTAIYEQRLLLFQTILRDISQSLNSLSETAPESYKNLLHCESQFLKDYVEYLIRDSNFILTKIRLHEKLARTALDVVGSL